MPSDWKMVPLKDLLIEKDIRASSLGKFKSNDVEILSLTKNHGLIPQTERFGKRIATADVTKYKVVRKDWIVYNPYVIWEGAVHSLKQRDIGLVSPVYSVWETVEQDGGYMDYLLRTPSLIQAYNMLASGAVNRRRSIRKDAFLSIKVPVPLLKERRAVAYILRTVQQAKKATEKVITATQQLKASLMKHLFTYGPVTFGQADHVPLKETEIGLVPDHWDMLRFGEVVIITSGQVDPKEELYSKMLHVGPENIEEGTGRLIKLRSAAEVGLISGKYLFGPDDVLYSKIRPYLRKAALPTFTGICSADMYALKPREMLVREFLLCWLLSEPFTRQAVSYQSRTGIPKINRKQLDSTWIPVPPKHEQEEIAKLLLSCDHKFSSEQGRYNVLNILFHSMLEYLMTGKLRIKDFPIPEKTEAA